jgi:rubredoxin
MNVVVQYSKCGVEFNPEQPGAFLGFPFAPDPQTRVCPKCKQEESKKQEKK